MLSYAYNFTEMLISEHMSLIFLSRIYMFHIFQFLEIEREGGMHVCMCTHTHLYSAFCIGVSDMWIENIGTTSCLQILYRARGGNACAHTHTHTLVFCFLFWCVRYVNWKYRYCLMPSDLVYMFSVLNL